MISKQNQLGKVKTIIKTQVDNAVRYFLYLSMSSSCVNSFCCMPLSLARGHQINCFPFSIPLPILFGVKENRPPNINYT